MKQFFQWQKEISLAGTKQQRKILKKMKTKQN